MRRVALGIAALILLASDVAWAGADNPLPGDACAAGQANQFTLNGLFPNTGFVNGMFCNGSTWTGAINFQSTGFVGIGTTTPGEKLEVAGNILLSGGGALKFPDATYAVQNVFGQHIMATAGNALALYSGTSGLSIRNQSDTATSLVVLDTGAVGIGTNSPAAMLHVNGEAIIGGTTLGCSTTTKGAIRYNSSTQAFDYCGGVTPSWTTFSGGAATPAGSDQQVQLNSNGVLYASSGLKFNSATGTLTVTGSSSLAAAGSFTNTASTGANYGVYGSTSSTGASAGVYGVSTVASGSGGPGVEGVATSAGVVAVYGHHNASGNGTGIGVKGDSPDANGYGVQGVVSSASAGTGDGVYGSNTGANQTGAAGYFTSASTVTGVGVFGTITGAANTGYAVQAINNSTTGWGVYSSGTSSNYFAGRVGVGTTGPAALLDVAGEIRTTGNILACVTGTKGSIRFNSTSNAFDYCGGATPSWIAFTGGSVTPAGSNTQVQLNDAGVLYASSGLTYNSTTGQLSATASSGSFPILGTNNSIAAGAAGLKGISPGSTGATYGVVASDNSPTGYGLYAYNTATSGTAIFAAAGSSGFGSGVEGYTASTTSGTIAVWGHAVGTTGNVTGVFGDSASATGYGGYFSNFNANGVALYANGVIQFSSASTVGCSSTTAGSVRYNSSTTTMQYCNGSAWNPFSGLSTFATTWTDRTSAASSWTGGAQINALLMNGSTLVAAGSSSRFATSTDNGATWADRTSAATSGWTGGSDIFALTMMGSTVAAVGNSATLGTTADNGATWTNRSSAVSGWANGALYAVTYNGTTLLAAGANGKVGTSTDGGASWTDRSSAASFLGGQVVSAAASSGSTLVIAGANGKIGFSTDGGATWTDRSSEANGWTNSQQIYAMVYSGSTLIAVASGGRIGTSSDSGATWTDRTSAAAFWTGNLALRCLTLNGSMIVAGGDSNHIALSSDLGATWTDRTSAASPIIANQAFYALTVNGTTLIMGGPSGKIATSP